MRIWSYLFLIEPVCCFLNFIFFPKGHFTRVSSDIEGGTFLAPILSFRSHILISIFQNIKNYKFYFEKNMTVRPLKNYLVSTYIKRVLWKKSLTKVFWEYVSYKNIFEKTKEKTLGACRLLKQALYFFRKISKAYEDTAKNVFLQNIIVMSIIFYN